jgi:hypothetical protein
LGSVDQSGHVSFDEASVHGDHQGALVVQLDADAVGQPCGSDTRGEEERSAIRLTPRPSKMRLPGSRDREVVRCGTDEDIEETILRLDT